MTITTEMKRKCIAREIALRHRVYAKRIANGDMTEAEAATEIATMEAILADYAMQETPR